MTTPGGATVEDVRLIAPVARVDLGESPLALRIWEGAAGRIGHRRTRGECRLRAADVAVPGVSPEAVAWVARSLQFQGIKVYRTWVHVDVRPTRWRETA